MAWALTRPFFQILVHHLSSHVDISALCIINSDVILYVGLPVLIQEIATAQKQEVNWRLTQIYQYAPLSTNMSYL